MSPNEFTVGKVGSAKPLSLIIPTNNYEETIIVGHIDNENAAVFLSGQFRSQYFESNGNESWGGIIIPDVRIEVDETSSLDAASTDTPPISVTRIDTRIVIAARNERSFGRSTLVTLHDDLVTTGAFQAVFAQWQIVIGNGPEKRVLWSTRNDSAS